MGLQWWGRLDHSKPYRNEQISIILKKVRGVSIQDSFLARLQIA
jgi:hypothetical protein